MLRLILNISHLIRAVFRSRSELAIENLAFRQQLAVLKARGPRPRLNLRDRVFWISLRCLGPKWVESLVIVKPETVVRWHRAASKHFGVGNRAGLGDPPPARGPGADSPDAHHLPQPRIESEPTRHTLPCPLHSQRTTELAELPVVVMDQKLGVFLESRRSRSVVSSTRAVDARSR